MPELGNLIIMRESSKHDGYWRNRAHYTTTLGIINTYTDFHHRFGEMWTC